MAGPGPSKSLGDTYDEGLCPAGDDSWSAAIGSSRVRVTASINASTSSTRARLYARPSESSTAPSYCITGGAPSDDVGTVAVVVPRSLSSAMAGYHTAPNAVAGSGSSASHTRLAIVASAMGLAPLNCVGLRPWRDTMDANSLAHTFLNRSVALVHRNASGRSSSAAPSGGRGLATRVNHHESSVGMCAAGLLPHIASRFSTSPPYDLRRKSLGEGNRSPPDRPPSSPLLPTGYRAQTQSSGRADGGDHRSRSPYTAGQSTGFCHPMVRPATCASHTWCIPAAISIASSIFARSRSPIVRRHPAHTRARSTPTRPPDASPSRTRANHGGTRTGRTTTHAGRTSTDVPGGGRLDVRVDHRLHRGAGVSRAPGFVPRVHDAHVSRGAAPEQEPPVQQLLERGYHALHRVIGVKRAALGSRRRRVGEEVPEQPTRARVLVAPTPSSRRCPLRRRPPFDAVPPFGSRRSHHAEPSRRLEAPPYHQLVPLLEHVERQLLPRSHGVQDEQGELTEDLAGLRVAVHPRSTRDRARHLVRQRPRLDHLVSEKSLRQVHQHRVHRPLVGRLVVQRSPARRTRRPRAVPSVRSRRRHPPREGLSAERVPAGRGHRVDEDETRDGAGQRVQQLLSVDDPPRLGLAIASASR